MAMTDRPREKDLKRESEKTKWKNKKKEKKSCNQLLQPAIYRFGPLTSGAAENICIILLLLLLLLCKRASVTRNDGGGGDLATTRKTQESRTPAKGYNIARRNAKLYSVVVGRGRLSVYDVGETNGEAPSIVRFAFS